MYWICQWVVQFYHPHPNMGNVLTVPIWNGINANHLHRNLATNEQAWQDTRDLPGLQTINFPSDAMVWATAATRNATTWGHIDDHGMGTVVKIMTGRKYWVIFRPKVDGTKPAVARGDFGSSKAFIDHWVPTSAGDSVWDHEGILLQAGDIL
jgi:hypothetical protein